MSVIALGPLPRPGLCLGFSLGHPSPVKNMPFLRTTPVITYFLADENPILVYVALLFFFILSLLERKTNVCVSTVT